MFLLKRSSSTLVSIANALVNSYAHNSGGAGLGIAAKSSCMQKLVGLSQANIHTTAHRCDLKEFFDNDQNWEVVTVNVGRSWEKTDLRQRSNGDLHKLWYVLLKELNMLLTMKAEHDRIYVPLPNPERLEKVEVSMDNLRDVVDERNKALSMLETGELPHPKWIDDTDELGRPIRRMEEEHLIPKEHNEEFTKKYEHTGDWTRRFALLHNERERKREWGHYFRSKKLYNKLLAKYPHLAEDPEFLKNYCKEKMYPIEKNPDVESLMEDQS